MVTRYSQCHFAETFEDTRLVDNKPGYRVMRCSWCGAEDPKLVPMHSVVNSDIEVVLRRWKDGDTDFTTLVEKLDSSLWGSWWTAFNVAREKLQTGEPQFVRPAGSAYFVKADERGNDLRAADPESKVKS